MYLLFNPNYIEDRTWTEEHAGVFLKVDESLNSELGASPGNADHAAHGSDQVTSLGQSEAEIAGQLTNQRRGPVTRCW